MIIIKTPILLSPDNPQNNHQGTRKGHGGKGRQRKRKLLCFFLLGTIFLAKNGLTLKSLLAMGPGMLPHMFPLTSSISVLAAIYFKNKWGPKISSSLNRLCVCVCACLHVWFMQKSCKNILVHQKSNLHTFFGHCRGWLTWCIAIQKECWLKHFRSLGCGNMS